MFRVLLGDVRDGRLQRLPYLGYWLLLMLLMFGFMLAMGLAAGVGEHIISGDLQAAQEKLRDWFALPAMLVMMVAMPLFFFMEANIMAKRIRDIGLPGWWVVLAIVLLTGSLSYMLSPQVSNGAQTLIWVLLLLIPTGAFAGQVQKTP